MSAHHKGRSRFDPSLLPEAPDLSFESGLWDAGCQYVAGIDEAGRGALAGPVAAGAVIFLPGTDPTQLEGVRDSKQMTPRQRESHARGIQLTAVCHAVGFASSQEIDHLGILPATRLAIQRALGALPVKPDHLLLDCLLLPENPVPQTSLIKGDCRSLSIAAASVLAKTERDALMRQLDQEYPGYDLAKHKGYGTQDHRQAIAELGNSPIHRKTFKLKKPA